VPPHWWIPLGAGNPTPSYDDLKKKLGPDKMHSRWKNRDGTRSYAIVTAADKPHPSAVFLADEDDLVPDR
jgi:hypothetical protein